MENQNTSLPSGHASAPTDSVIVRAPELRSVVRAIVERGGSEALEAELVADNLVLANMSGHDSHGVGMLPRYVDALLEGGLRINQQVRIELDTGTLLRLDGNSGYGQVVGRQAMQLGVARAERHGVCVVALANAHHLGRIGHWAEQCLERGLISLHFVNVVSRPIVAPFGGLDARTGTNPVCVAIPRQNEPAIVLDFATSRIAQGKTRIAYNRGQQVPPDTIIDDRGAATTDPRYTVVAPFGAILPFGQHKGFGLSLIAELLGGALTGGATCRQPDTGSRVIINGMFSILIDPAQLGTAQHFAAEAEAYVAWLKQSPVPDDASAISLPGERGRRSRERCEAQGIAIDPTTWAEISGAGQKLGLSRREVQSLAGLD
jgi:hydroxycarboxylate dehydrogenase B